MKQIFNIHFSRFMFCFLLLSFSITGFAQLPTISSFSPTSGSIGTIVTITRTNLSTTTAVNYGRENASFIPDTVTFCITA